MDVIEEFGCDSLRYFLATSSAPGMDLRFDEEKVKSTWNFINKLWNASRFVLMNLEDFKEENYTLENLSISDKWILTKLNETIKQVRKNMDKYEFNNVGSILYSFIWDDFCDWYIELSKINMNNTTKSVLVKVLTSILKMLHPIMPYVTEEIYSMMPIKESESIVISSYPKYEKEYVYISDKEILDTIIKDIVSIRNIKASNNITKEALVMYEVSNQYLDLFKSQLKIKDEQTINNELDGYLKAEYNSNNIKITYFYKGEEVDSAKVEEEISKLKESIVRREKLLSNENYVNKAPKNIVDLDRKKLEEEKIRLEQLIK